MIVSNIIINYVDNLNHRGYVRIETKSDAIRCLCDYTDMANYIDEFGDNEVVYDGDYRVYRVPAFADAIAKYSKAKAKDCAKNGCE